MLFIRELISYEGETATELQAAFREAVDDHLATCQELSRESKAPSAGRDE
jgi:predicted HicB family RNase H-like nuclease